MAIISFSIQISAYLAIRCKKIKVNSIGVYKGYKIVPFHIHDKATGKDTSGVLTFLRIMPNPKGVKKVIPQKKINEAQEYEFFDTEYYVFANSANIEKRF